MSPDFKDFMRYPESSKDFMRFRNISLRFVPLFEDPAVIRTLFCISTELIATQYHRKMALLLQK